MSDNDLIELLQAKAADLLSDSQARDRLRTIRPDWFPTINVEAREDDPPRYYVSGDKAPFEVVDHIIGASVARFFGHMNNEGERYAREHADRLNREAQA